MITPLGQRQIFQTANVEAVRASLEVSGQIQREQARKKTADDKTAEDQAGVQVISGSERIITEERQQRQKQGGADHQKEKDGDGEGGNEKAKSADSHLDFLA
ncbi:MAG: hypothetical protein Q8O00_09920 [Holophaga sp.]|nr:hypothetical protein [Holophaga sp.]